MNYLIPANSKSGQLIFNIFRPFDLILFASGFVISVLSLMIVSPTTFAAAGICLIPVAICTLLVVPVPNYHNVLTVIIELIMFYYNRRNYKWRGWCNTDEYK